MFKAIKDTALSKGLQLTANSLIKEYGRVLKLNIDSKDKSIDLEVMLDGEVEPISIKVDKYNIIEENGKKFIEIDNITTSRSWLNRVATNFINGKKFELPKKYSDIIESIIWYLSKFTNYPHYNW